MLFRNDLRLLKKVYTFSLMVFENIMSGII